MSTTKRILLGVVLFMGLIRIAQVLVRMNTPRAPAGVDDPEAISQRAAEQSEQLAQVAKLLDASEIDDEQRRKLDEARDDAMRSLRDLAREANAAGLTSLGYEALELERGLLHDARTTCSLGGPKKVDAAAAALSPAARAPLEDRLTLARQHVSRACERAMLMPAGP